MKFGKEKELEIFTDLATMTIAEVGHKWKFDQVYTTHNSVRNAVYKVKNKVSADYPSYGLSEDAYNLVMKAMQARQIQRPKGTSLAEKVKEKQEIVSLMQNIRDKTFVLIDRKLDMVSRSPKTLKSMSFKELGVIGGISFDKVQILKGEATENIAVRAKIDKSLTAEELLALTLKQRESMVENNKK